MKKWICFILAALMFACLAAGCSPKKESASGETTAPYETEAVTAQETETTAEATQPPVHYTPDEKEVYALTTVNIRTAPSTESSVAGKLSRNRSIKRLAIGDNGWSQVSYEGTTCYIASQYLTENAPAAPGAPSADGQSFAASLDASQGHSQILCVVAEGNTCTLTMHQKDENGLWKQVLETDGVIGQNGLYKEREGDKKTPVGVFSFIKAFGIKDDPGTAFSYTKVDDTMHWVDDPESAYYNRFVSTREVTPDWNSSEHLIEYVTAYNYCLALNYNPDCIPYKGCAIFLHCPKPDGSPTSGCIGIPEEDMVFILQNISTDCPIVISDEDIIYRY